MNINQLSEEYQAVMNGFGFGYAETFEILSADEMFTLLDKKRESMMVTRRPRVDHELMKIEAALEYLVSFMVRWDMAEG